MRIRPRAAALAAALILASLPASAAAAPGKDGARMVLVPEGAFHMGTSGADIKRLQRTCPSCRADRFGTETPHRLVQLHAFYIDKYPVTVRLFRRFAEETGWRTLAEKEGWGWVLSGGKAENLGFRMAVRMRVSPKRLAKSWSGKKYPKFRRRIRTQ
ncbi:MAG: SUMF1/EgtB/PvdO family nonheme iron enzyme [Nitrospinota bacterium]|nr:SUMF1/EgtB/PvdO family nonheme iron enzyme [Nitrospinota bacterium]